MSLIHWEILPKPSLLAAPKTRCDPVALLKCIFWPLNRNSSGLKGKADKKNKKVKGNRSPFSCKSGNPIPQSGLEFRLLPLLSRWQWHGKDTTVSQGCSSSTGISQVRGHKCYPFRICSVQKLDLPSLDPFFIELQLFFLILVKNLKCWTLSAILLLASLLNWSLLTNCNQTVKSHSWSLQVFFTDQCEQRQALIGIEKHL